MQLVNGFEQDVPWLCGKLIMISTVVCESRWLIPDLMCWWLDPFTAVHGWTCKVFVMLLMTARLEHYVYEYDYQHKVSVHKFGCHHKLELLYSFFASIVLIQPAFATGCCLSRSSNLLCHCGWVGSLLAAKLEFRLKFRLVRRLITFGI